MQVCRAPRRAPWLVRRAWQQQWCSAACGARLCCRGMAGVRDATGAGPPIAAQQRPASRPWLPAAWPQASRQQLLQQVERALQQQHGVQQPQRQLLLVVDDVNHLRSMRHECVQLARACEWRRQHQQWHTGVLHWGLSGRLCCYRCCRRRSRVPAAARRLPARECTLQHLRLLPGAPCIPPPLHTHLPCCPRRTLRWRATAAAMDARACRRTCCAGWRLRLSRLRPTAGRLRTRWRCQCRTAAAAAAAVGAWVADVHWVARLHRAASCTCPAASTRRLCCCAACRLWAAVLERWGAPVPPLQSEGAAAAARQAGCAANLASVAHSLDIASRRLLGATLAALPQVRGGAVLRGTGRSRACRRALTPATARPQPLTACICCCCWWPQEARRRAAEPLNAARKQLLAQLRQGSDGGGGVMAPEGGGGGRAWSDAAERLLAAFRDACQRAQQEAASAAVQQPQQLGGGA